MPIPTRSASLREPRQPPSFTRPTTSGASKPPARATTEKPRSSTIASSTDGSSAKDNVVSARGRTLLPQRSNVTREEGHGQVRFQPPESKLPRGEVSPKRPPQTTSATEQAGGPVGKTGGSVPSRRESLMRPGLKVSAPRSQNVSATKGATPTLAPPSPRKQSALRSPTQTSTRPASPKKTDMPPPPRPGRSASLRQPPGPGSGPTVAPRGHARHRSQVVPTGTKTVQPDVTPGAQRARAQFSTYQQHYSPKKPAKPPTPTPGDGPGPGNLLVPSSWPDIAGLQTELLQLSLFHSNSLQRRADWRAESESRLRTKYDGVAGQYRSLLVDEKTRQRTVNAQALGFWQQNCREHRGSPEFPEQIQILSQVLQEISDLVTSGMNGRYSSVVKVFEQWLERVDQIRRLRELPAGLHEMDFIDPLDGTWKEELHALQVKLEMCTRHLQSLDILGFGEVERLDQSALARVTQALVESIQLMTQEIQAMRAVEAEVVRSERETVAGLAAQLTSDLHERRPARGGIWNEA